MSIVLYLIGLGSRGRIDVGSPPEAQEFWAIHDGQMSIVWYLICDTGRTQIGVGSKGRIPRSSGVLHVKLSSDEHILIPYLWHWQDINWCWVQGAELPEAQEFYTLNYRQMSIVLYLNCDTCRSRVGLGSRGRSPRKLRGFEQWITVRWAYFYNCQKNMHGPA